MLSLFKPKWRVTCEDATGLTFVEILSATTRAELEQVAIEREWRIISAVRNKFEPKRAVKLAISGIVDRVTTKNLVAFYRQLSNMYKNHVPLLDAMIICSTSTSSAGLKNVLREVTEDLGRGMDLASAFAKHPGVFDRLSCCSLRAANTGGYLDQALMTLANDAETKNDINRKLNGALIYPASVCIMAVIAIIVFGYKVMPAFKPLYSQSGIALPLPTTVLLKISDFLVAYPWTIPFFIAIPIYIFLRKNKIFTTPFFQTIFLKLPLIKELALNIYLSKYLRMIAQLTKANIPYPIQLTLLREASSVPVFKDAWRKIRLDVERGAGFTAALSKYEAILTPFTVGNLKAGEKSGQVAETAEYLAEFYEVEVKDYIKNINAIIEPILILGLGSVIAFLMFAMFLPIFDLAKLA